MNRGPAVALWRQPDEGRWEACASRVAACASGSWQLVVSAAGASGGWARWGGGLGRSVPEGAPPHTARRWGGAPWRVDLGARGARARRGPCAEASDFEHEVDAGEPRPEHGPGRAGAEDRARPTPAAALPATGASLASTWLKSADCALRRGAKRSTRSLRVAPRQMQGAGRAEGTLGAAHLGGANAVGASRDPPEHARRHNGGPWQALQSTTSIGLIPEDLVDHGSERLVRGIGS